MAQIQEGQQALTIRHILVVVTGILCLFGPAALVINTWSVFLVPVTSSLSISSGDFTFYVTLLFLSAAACSPLAGNLMHRCDLRIVISAAAALCALGLFLCSTYTAAWQFYVSGILEGAGICIILFLTPSTLMITFMITNATAQLGNYLPTYLYHLADLQVAGLTTASVVIMASVIAACLQTAHAIAKICLGQVVDHSNTIALLIGCGCGFAGILFVWQGYASQQMVYFGAALFGVHFAMTNVLGPSFTLRLFGPREYTKIYSRITTVMNIMPAVSLVVFSALSEASWDYLFITVLLLIAIVCCTGFATILFGRRMGSMK